MQSIEHFAPNLSGPTCRQAPFRKTVGADEAEGEGLEDEDDGRSRAPDALIAEENANAKYLIGLDESPEDCSVAKLAALRAKLSILEECTRKFHTAARRQAYATEAPDAQMDLAAEAATAAAADHRGTCVDLRVLARTMGASFQELGGLRERHREKVNVR